MKRQRALQLSLRPALATVAPEPQLLQLTVKFLTVLRKGDGGKEKS